jgi:predicted ATPase
MLQSVTIQNFKSFEKATLPLAPLTLLIGANASGKSNFIEGLQLLSWLASGRRLEDISVATRDQELSLRGSLDDLAYQGKKLAFGCETAPPAPLSFQVYLYIGLDGLQIFAERLYSNVPREPIALYTAVPVEHGSHAGFQALYNDFEQSSHPIPCNDQQAVFTQLTSPASFATEHKRSQREIPQAASHLRQSLEGILFLDPIPRRMRGYSFRQERKLQGDGEAISSVLRHLVDDGRKVEILDFIRSLPEQDIQDISFLETPRGEVMVQLHETFGGRPVPREAALLSDGTLRVLAVAAALLSVPERSMVVIEEIDNGVHPNRAKHLLEDIQRIALDRKLRVLLTTHNPALLDALPPEAVPDVVACYRDPEKGDRRLVRLEDLASYPELVAQGPLGQLVTKGTLDRFLKAPEKRDPEAKVEQGLAWISDFRRKSGTS